MDRTILSWRQCNEKMEEDCCCAFYIWVFILRRSPKTKPGMCGKANKCLSRDSYQTSYGWKPPNVCWVLTKKFKETKVFRAQILVIVLLIFTWAEIAYATQYVDMLSTLIITVATTVMARFNQDSDKRWLPCLCRRKNWSRDGRTQRH